MSEGFMVYYRGTQRAKQIGSFVITLLALFWVFIAEQHPNPIFRCVFFASAFGSTAWGFAQPFIWLAKSYQADYLRIKPREDKK